MPSLVAIWVWLCAYLNCAGWTLSALHQLNATGYSVALSVWCLALLVWWKKTPGRLLPPRLWQKFRRRFRRPFPLAFLILAAMSFLGGAAYAPTNYDTLAYRLPRVLHWLAAGQWQWVHTVFDRMNIHSVGIEWLYAPVIALLKTDRPLFLIHFVSFLFLPGLVFSILTRLGVRRRVAWHWMWLVPSGYGFLLQAGGIGNDLFGVILVLAGIDFALRTDSGKSTGCFFTSLVAMAAATSAKSSNLPFLLPWGIILLPAFKLLFKCWWQTAAVCVMAAVASAAPLMALNLKYTGSPTGGMIAPAGVKNETIIRVSANMVLMTIQNFVPPVFPIANRWNQLVEHELAPELAAKLLLLIEQPGCRFELQEMQVEENSSLGFGVCVLLLASALAAGFVPKKINLTRPSARLIAIKLSFAAAFLAIMVMSRWTAVGRYLLPYYVPLLPLLLASRGHDILVRRRWWRRAAYVVFTLATGLLVLSPSRPLFPAQWVADQLYACSPDSRWAIRQHDVYTVYHQRSHAFNPVVASLPPDLRVLGLATYDDPETSLWQPFGSRRIEHVCPQDTEADLRARGVQYILVKNDMFLGNFFDGSVAEWSRRRHGQIIQKFPLELQIRSGVRDWYLVKLN